MLKRQATRRQLPYPNRFQEGRENQIKYSKRICAKSIENKIHIIVFVHNIKCLQNPPQKFFIKLHNLKFVTSKNRQIVSLNWYPRTPNPKLNFIFITYHQSSYVPPQSMQLHQYCISTIHKLSLNIHVCNAYMNCNSYYAVYSMTLL